ncbi:acetate kinase [bacterium]|nr:acetate kinase [bacterium]
MNDTIFVLNCGSSSIKFQLIEPHSHEVILKGLAENIGSKRCQIKHAGGTLSLPGTGYEEVIAAILELLQPYQADIKGIGHRVVHGGEHFSESALITDEVIAKIKDCNSLAPLHNPANLKGIEIFRKSFPMLPNVAVFDTAFHMSLQKQAYLYAIAYEHYEKFHVRRYGFHGTSHRFITMEAEKLLPHAKNIIIAHLGNGASVCAVKNGKSVDTSMGFTPLEGLVMGTRSGDIDPGMLPFLGKKLDLNTEGLLQMLNKESGLLGISGISSDMRLLEEEMEKGNKQATLAIEIFCYRLAKYIASYEVPTGGADALIFTGGIGENSPLIRKKVIDLLPSFTLDTKLHQNLARGQAGIISSKGKTIGVIPTNEELLIAKDTDDIRRKL